MAGAKHLMLTHLAPPLGAERNGPWKVPGGPLTEQDYRKSAEAGGFTGNIIVGTDLASVKLPLTNAASALTGRSRSEI
jgi:ribonuclease Z